MHERSCQYCVFAFRRFIYPVDKNDVCAQVRMAAQCCQLTDIMISQCDSMWLVPQRLIDQARRAATVGPAAKRQIARKSLSLSPQSVGGGGSLTAIAKSSVGPRMFHAKHVHKIVI